MKKAPKSKSPQSAIAANQDIVGLITTLVEKLVSLETKIDTVLSRLPDRPVEMLRQQPSSSVSIERHKDTRLMYKVICADCGRHCEVPFKPSIGRAVYCKECFTKRKTGGNLTPRVEERPSETSLVHQSSSEKLQVVKPIIAPVVKKKPSVKKRKKKAAK